MHLTVHKPGKNHGHYKARIEQVADAAGELVAQHVGGTLPRVRIFLTDGDGFAKLHAHHEKLLVADGHTGKTRSLSGYQDWSIKRYLGATVIDHQGPVMLINGHRQLDMRDLDATIVHEFGHCVVMNHPDVLPLYKAYLRRVYLSERTAEAAEYSRRRGRYEDDARRLEKLARKLPSPREHKED